MSSFYASYSPTNAVDVTGSITATNPSIGVTGSPVPADATYTGMNVGGNLTGMTGTSNGLKVDGSAVTQPISASSLPLPTGASTSAKQPALGTAGTASTDVLTVQGIGAMTPLLVTQSGSGTQQSVNVAQFGSNNVVTGTGTGGNGIPRVTVSSDSSLTSVTTVSTVTAVTAISNALPSGTNTLGGTIPTATTAATFQAEGSIAAGSLTGSFQTILTPSANTKIIYLRNNTDQSVSFSFDAGTTTNFVLDSGDQVSIDYVANGIIASTSAIQVKNPGSASTTGNVRVNACH